MTSCRQNVGAVARACNCFECEAIRFVDPECSITARSALNAAMGGQRLLWQTDKFDTVAEAVKDCAYSIAFARWTEGWGPYAVVGHQALAVHYGGILRVMVMLWVQAMRSRTYSSPQRGCSNIWARLGW